MIAAASWLVRQPLLQLIRLYRDYISLLFAPRCRFYPSCSQYAHDAIEVHGVVYGSWLIMVRLAKCHPWHQGGSDPIPNATSSTKHRCEHRH